MNAEIEPSAGPFSPKHGDVELFARFAELIAKSKEKPPLLSEPEEPVQDCSSSLQFIRETGEKLREAQRRSERLASNAYEIARKAVASMQEAQDRAILAEADAAAARARAEAAEEELQALKREIERDDPVASGVDQWLREAHLQLRLAREQSRSPNRKDRSGGV